MRISRLPEPQAAIACHTAGFTPQDMQNVRKAYLEATIC